ncbi:hypothetical protein [Sandaracinus amylolyticus]|uniref:hypothetical protein n=1 Tax=Sandaracinus amylolyticus TaxID=927083 RepID=UPI001F192569|nr:hypothetical protein [Sandaracinus amylolyticus]UJR83587.1 Hypothetical protein I5071_56550 [Sandaracinus amylolyticus]
MVLGVRAHVRAVLILFVLVGSCIEGLPVPRVAPAHLSRPVGRRELERWTRILRGAGVDIDEPTLRRHVIDVSSELTVMHDRAREPLRRWFELTHTTQRWSLFPVADPDPYWMHVEARSGGEWTLLYRPNDPDHAFLSSTLEYRRVRAVWNPGSGGTRADHPRFVDWIAREIFARREDVDAVRVRYLRHHVSLPGEPRDPETHWMFEEVRER